MFPDSHQPKQAGFACQISCKNSLEALEVSFLCSKISPVGCHMTLSLLTLIEWVLKGSLASGLAFYAGDFIYMSTHP